MAAAQRSPTVDLVCLSSFCFVPSKSSERAHRWWEPMNFAMPASRDAAMRFWRPSVPINHRHRTRETSFISPKFCQEQQESDRRRRRQPAIPLAHLYLWLSPIWISCPLQRQTIFRRQESSANLTTSATVTWLPGTRVKRSKEVSLWVWREFRLFDSHIQKRIGK